MTQRTSQSPIESEIQEPTVITRVGLPKAPEELRETYFEDVTRVMATFVEEVRGYRADLLKKAENEEEHWQQVREEIAGVRQDFSSLKLELETREHESVGKIKALEANVEKLSAEVTRLGGVLKAHGLDGS